MADGNFLGIELGIGDAIESVVDFLTDNLQGVFDVIDAFVGLFTGLFQGVLMGIPSYIIILLIGVLALWRLSVGFAIFTIAALVLLTTMDLWPSTMSSLGLVLSATLISLLIGVPLGILAAKNDHAEAVIKPVLDFMQTMPAFVYLIPAVMFFGLGAVPGTIATIIFSMPPAVRLTNLGIRQVPKEMVEAGRAFGCTPSQLLFKVQFPSAMPSIMAGINQTIMLALSMVVIASMIGAGGLGDEVLTGIQRMQVGTGFEGGLGVVILAIILDRLTQSFSGNGRKGKPILARLKQALGPQPTNPGGSATGDD